MFFLSKGGLQLKIEAWKELNILSFQERQIKDQIPLNNHWKATANTTCAEVNSYSYVALYSLNYILLYSLI
jgi:hypothetical protein